MSGEESFKVTYFEFPRELSEEEEESLIACFQITQGKLEAKLKGIRRLLKSRFYQMFGGGIAQTTFEVINASLENMNQLIRLEKKSPVVYAFKLRWRSLNIAGTTPIPGRLKMLFGKKATPWESVQDSFVGDFKGWICKEVGFRPEEVKVSFGGE